MHQRIRAMIQRSIIYGTRYFPGRGYNYYAGPGYYDRGYGRGGPRFIIRGW